MNSEQIGDLAGLGVLLLMAFVCLTIGITSLVTPQKVSEFQRDHGVHFPWYDSFQETPAGLVRVRISGLLFGFCGLGLMYLAIRAATR